LHLNGRRFSACREDPKTRECMDIDECKEAPGTPFAADCHYLSSCINLISTALPDGTFSQGYSCNGCPEGYSGGGYGSDANSTGCVDVDECALDKAICGTGKCVNTEPGYRCIDKSECPPGFKLVGTSGTKRCVDIDECVEGINPTNANEPLCPPGQNQCDPKNGGCDLNVQCYNAQGTRYCGMCPVGFTGGNMTRDASFSNVATMGLTLPAYLPEYEPCRDINECDPCDGTGDPNCPLAAKLPKNGGCNELQTCVNAIGYNFCGDCAEGYKEDPILGCQVGDGRCCTAGCASAAASR
jgi:cubilin